MMRSRRRFIKPESRSEAFDRAVKALIVVLEKEGLDTAQRAAAEALSEGMQESQLLADYADNSRASYAKGHPCISRIVGRNCPTNRMRLTCPDGLGCRPPGVDHDSMILRNGRPEKFITHPYGLDEEQLREMLAFADRFSLEINIDGFSSHFPGRTIRVVWRRRTK